MEPIEEELEDESSLELPSEPMSLNMGPSHPAMHGTIRMVLKLDGEILKDVDVQPGYLHRGFEKSCERGTWTQVYPYADRLNYVSPMLNNNGWAMAVEKALGIKVPERCEYYRVILGEIARTASFRYGVGGLAMPPMRPKLCVRRAPVSCSRMSQTQSRTFTHQRKGVNAPSSIAPALLHVR